MCMILDGLYSSRNSRQRMFTSRFDSSRPHLQDSVCVWSAPINDGKWHDIRAERHGHNMVLEVDDGDMWKRNESLVSLITPESNNIPPGLLKIDKQDGVTVGGTPEFVGISVVTVSKDLVNSKFFW